MRLHFNIVLALALALALAIAGLAPSAQADITDLTCAGGDRVCRYDATQLPARALMRPARTLYAEPDEGAAVVRGNLPAFRPWYLYDQQDVDLSNPDDPKGWLHIGPDRDRAMGWIPAGDVVLWRSGLVVTYTNRGAGAEEDKRSRVLMFSALDQVKAMMEDADPAARSDTLIGAVESAEAAVYEAAGVVMAEPRRFVDFRSGFYMLPVIEHEMLSVGLDSQARYLRLVAATQQTEESSGSGPTTLRNETVRENVASGEVIGQGAEELGVDIKFVIDMTGSMQPYLDATQKAVGRVIGRIDALGMPADAVRYGLIGFTDKASECRGCGFEVVRNFTPELVEGQQIVSILANDAAARAADGGDWQETVYAGMEEAIQSDWRPNKIRVVILIGDAFAREVGKDVDQRRTADMVRQLASEAAGDRTVFVLALHARPLDIPVANNQNAEEQFRILATNPGTQTSQYFGFDVDRRNPAQIEERFIAAIYEAGEALASVAARIKGGDASVLSERREDAPGGETIAAAVEDIATTALVEILGRDALRPDELTAWAVDVDPRDPLSPTMQVRVLVEKRDLSELVKTLESRLAAYRRADILGDDFFSQIQATTTSTLMDEGSDERGAIKLAGAALVPSWLEALPYKSALLSLTPETFANMTPDERERFEVDLEDKILLLSDYVNDPDIWQKLSPDSAELSAVFPVPLSDLP